MESLFKKDLSIIKNHSTTTNIKTKWNFQRKYLRSTNNNSEIAWKIMQC